MAGYAWYHMHNSNHDVWDELIASEELKSLLFCFYCLALEIHNYFKHCSLYNNSYGLRILKHFFKCYV